MIPELVELVKEYYYLLFVAGLIVMFFLVLSILLNKKKAAIVPGSLFAVYAILFTVSVFYKEKLTGRIILAFGIYVFLEGVFTLVMATISYLEKRKFNLLFQLSSSIDSAILVYLNEKGEIVFFTKEFLNMFDVNNAKDFEQIVKYVHLGERQMSYKAFLKILTYEKEEDYALIIDLFNTKEKRLHVSKRKIINNGKLLGYVLINKKDQVFQEDTPTTYQVDAINLVNEALAIYESDNNKLLINNKMQNLLGVDSVNSLDEYIYAEDKKQIEKRARAEGEKSKIYYRINAQNNRVWVLETCTIARGKLTKVVRETDFKNLIYNFRDYSKMVQELEHNIAMSTNFALVFVTLHTLTQIKEKIGKDASMVLATQFFINLNNEIKDLKVFEIGYYKFAFFIKNEAAYKNILRDLNNNASRLQKTKIIFNDLAFEIKTYLGLVESKNVLNPTPELMIEAAEGALELASNKNYPKDFSIYISKVKELEGEEREIDLSDDFLQRIMK